MAGDWIKLEHATLDKPEVARLADLLGITHGEGLELLLRFWVWADSNINPEKCPDFVPIMSPAYVDKMLHCPGFCGALSDVGWMKMDDHQLYFSLPNFGYHNGQTAKTRAYEQKKKFRQRMLSRNSPENVPITPGPEKRREEVLTSASVLSEPQRPSSVNGKTMRLRATRLPPDWRLPEDLKTWAINVHHLEPDRVVRIGLAFRDYWVAKPGSAGTKMDWAATWRNWIRKEAGDA